MLFPGKKNMGHYEEALPMLEQALSESWRMQGEGIGGLQRLLFWVVGVTGGTYSPEHLDEWFQTGPGSHKMWWIRKQKKTQLQKKAWTWGSWWIIDDDDDDDIFDLYYNYTVYIFHIHTDTW